MRRTAALAGMLCVFSVLLPPAGAETVDATLAAFRAAVQARASDPGASSREAAKLGAADAALAGVTIAPDGSYDDADVTALQKAGRALGGSRTSDTGVFTTAAAFVRCMVGVLEDAAPALLDDLAIVFSDSTRTALQSKLDDAADALQRAATFADTDPAQAVAEVRVAMKLLAIVSGKLDALLARYEDAGVLYRQSSDLVGNPGPRRVTILRVECNVDVTPQMSAPFHLSGDISSFASPSYRLPYGLDPTFFFDYDNALGGAIYDRVGGEFVNYRGAVRLVLRGHPPVDLPVSR